MDLNRSAQGTKRNIFEVSDMSALEKDIDAVLVPVLLSYILGFGIRLHRLAEETPFSVRRSRFVRSGR